MKMFLTIACLLVFASWSQAFHHRQTHGCTGVTVTACQGKAAACTGAQVTACRGTTGCFGSVAALPRKTVTKTTVDACGNITQTTRSRGTVLVAVPTPTVEAVPAPKKK